MSSRNAQPNFSEPGQSRLQAELDVLLRKLHRTARLLVGATTHSDRTERDRLVATLERGGHAKPKVSWEPVPIGRDMWAALQRARELAPRSVASALYLRRLEELETELLVLESLGEPKRVRPMVARLFGTGAEKAVDGEDRKVLDIAHEILAETPVEEEPATVPARSLGGLSLEALMLQFAKRVGLDVTVRVDSSLIASAAVGERTVFIAERLFGEREAYRLAIHEVHGHLVSAFNGRAQRLGIFAIGTAGSYGTQEGLSILLEERAGLLDGARRRTLAARLLTTHAMHAGVSFGDAARELVREHGFVPAQAIGLCERAYRGGGVSRDAVYLTHWLRVKRSIELGHASLAELQVGKVALEDLEDLRKLREEGLLGPPVYGATLARSFGTTALGTRFEMSPPSRATSLTRFDAT